MRRQESDGKFVTDRDCGALKRLWEVGRRMHECRYDLSGTDDRRFLTKKRDGEFPLVAFEIRLTARSLGRIDSVECRVQTVGTLISAHQR